LIKPDIQLSNKVESLRSHKRRRESNDAEWVLQLSLFCFQQLIVIAVIIKLNSTNRLALDYPISSMTRRRDTLKELEG